MKQPQSHRVRFLLRHGRWPRVASLLYLTLAAQVGSTVIDAARDA